MSTDKTHSTHVDILLLYIARGVRGFAIAGVLLATPFSGLPLVICGVLKIAYDVALLFSFRHVKPPEEMDIGKR
jgi:hypothetical protein